jgi:Domain of unknown function (DUF4129)
MRIKCTYFLSALLVLVSVPVTHGATRALQQSSASPAPTSANVYTDASSFGGELQRIGDAIKTAKADPAGLGAVRKALPSHWEVTKDEQHYYVSAEPLDALLREAERAKDAKTVVAKASEAALWAFDLAKQANAFAFAKNERSKAAATLEQILSRREFGGVKGPSAWELLRQRVIQWLIRLLGSIFQQIGKYPIGASIFFWALIVGVVLWVALVLFRYWTRRGRLEELQSPESVTYSRTWQEWIQAAREAASRGDYREAIHSAYWAGISSLEDSEVVRKDRARTPREYMRLVSNSTQLVDTGRKTREALSALTVTLEQVWYGRRPASNQDFTNALQSVEALGCQLR